MNEFETLIATRRDGALNRSLVESLNAAPSQAAEIENFAAARKLTPDIARENLPQLKRDALHDQINAADYPRKSPITAELTILVPLISAVQLPELPALVELTAVLPQ